MNKSKDKDTKGKINKKSLHKARDSELHNQPTENLNNDDLFFKLKLDQPLSKQEITKLSKRCNSKFLLNDLVTINDLEGVKVLIEKVGVDINKERDSNTPLMIAAQKGHVELFKYLLLKGANFYHINKKGVNVLYEAFSSNSIEIIRYLVAEKLQGRISFNPNDKNIMNGYIPLLAAVYRGYKEIVEEWLKLKDIDVNIIEQEEGYNALHLCALESKSDKSGDLTQVHIARSLLKAGINPYIKTKVGDTSLMLFAQRNCSLGIRLLIQHSQEKYGSESIALLHKLMNVRNYQSATAMHSAAVSGNLEMVTLLLKHGAEINAGPPKTQTPLVVAINHNFFNLALQMAIGIEIGDKGASKKICADVNLERIPGENALSVALIKAMEAVENKDNLILHRIAPLLRKLVEATKDINSGYTMLPFGKHMGKCTALLGAAYIGDKMLVRMMLQKGASLKAVYYKNISIFRHLAYNRDKITESGRNISNTFPIILAHRIKLACIAHKINSTAARVDEPSIRSQIDESSLSLLVDYLCDEEYITLAVQVNDDLRVCFNKTQCSMVIQDQDFHKMLANIHVATQSKDFLEPSDFKSILEGSVESYKKDKFEKEGQKAKDLFLSSSFSFHREILAMPTSLEFENQLKEKLERAQIKLNSAEYNRQFDESKQLYDQNLAACAKIHDSTIHTLTDFDKLVTQDQPLAIKLAEELSDNLNQFNKNKNRLKTIFDGLDQIVEQLAEKNASVPKPKRKKKKDKYTPLLQSNAASKVEHKANNEKNSQNSVNAINQKIEPLTVGEVEEVREVGEHPRTQIEQQIEQLNAIKLKSNDELIVLNSQKPAFFSGANPKDNHTNNNSNTKQNPTEINSDDIHISKLILKKPSQTYPTNHTHHMKSNTTLANQTNLSPVLKVLEQLDELFLVLQYQPKIENAIANADELLLATNGLFGGFSLLMEMLSKVSGISIFPEGLAIALRNFSFHEDLELSAILGKNEQESLPQIRELCKKVAEYLQSLRVIDNQRKIPVNLKALLKLIDCPLFSKLATYALKRTEEQMKNLSSQIPMVEICMSQINRSLREMSDYQRICQSRPDILSDPTLFTTIQLGLGRTIARLGTYVASMKIFHYSQYRLNKLDQYKDYISLGNQYRHGDAENRQSDEKSPLAWRILINSLVQELLLGYFSNKESAELSNKQSLDLPNKETPGSLPQPQSNKQFTVVFQMNKSANASSSSLNSLSDAKVSNTTPSI